MPVVRELSMAVPEQSFYFSIHQGNDAFEKKLLFKSVLTQNESFKELIKVCGALYPNGNNGSIALKFGDRIIKGSDTPATIGALNKDQEYIIELLDTDSVTYALKVIDVNGVHDPMFFSADSSVELSDIAESYEAKCRITRGLIRFVGHGLDSSIAEVEQDQGVKVLYASIDKYHALYETLKKLVKQDEAEVSVSTTGDSVYSAEISHDTDTTYSSGTRSGKLHDSSQSNDLKVGIGQSKHSNAEIELTDYCFTQNNATEKAKSYQNKAANLDSREPQNASSSNTIYSEEHLSDPHASDASPKRKRGRRSNNTANKKKPLTTPDAGPTEHGLVDQAMEEMFSFDNSDSEGSPQSKQDQNAQCMLRGSLRPAENPFECGIVKNGQICPYTATFHHSMRKHRKEKHNDDKEYVYTCMICDEDYSIDNAHKFKSVRFTPLKGHLRKVHGLVKGMQAYEKAHKYASTRLFV